MRENAEQSEVATLVVEKNDDSQKAIKLVHDLMRKRNLDLASSAILSDLNRMLPGGLPINKIIHDPHFVIKEVSALLQIADACAFTIRCFLEGKPAIKQFCEVLTGNNLDVLKRDESRDFAGYNIVSSSL